MMVIWTEQVFHINLFSCTDEPCLCMSYLCRIAAAKLCGSFVQFVSCPLYDIKLNLQFEENPVFQKWRYTEIFISNYIAV